MLSHCVTIGDAVKVCSEEVLKSESVTKSYIPKLSPYKIETKDNTGDPDEQHQHKKLKVFIYSIISYTYTMEINLYMRACSLTYQRLHCPTLLYLKTKL